MVASSLLSKAIARSNGSRMQPNVLPNGNRRKRPQELAEGVRAPRATVATGRAVSGRLRGAGGLECASGR